MAPLDLDLVAAGEVEVRPTTPVTDDLHDVSECQGPTIKSSTFKVKVKFWWREEQSGATTWHHARCSICVWWSSMDTMRSRLLVSTSKHKNDHWLRAKGNTPTPLHEGAL